MNYKFPEAEAGVDISIIKSFMCYDEQINFEYPEFFPYRYSHYVDGNKHIFPLGEHATAFWITFNFPTSSKPIAVKIISEGFNLISGEAETLETYAQFQPTIGPVKQNYVVVPGQGPLYSAFYKGRPQQLVVNARHSVDDALFPLGQLEFVVTPLIEDPASTPLEEQKKARFNFPAYTDGSPAYLKSSDNEWQDGQMTWRRIPPTPPEYIVNARAPTFTRALPGRHSNKPENRLAIKFEDRARTGIFFGTLITTQTFFLSSHSRFDRAKAQYAQVEFISRKKEDVEKFFEKSSNAIKPAPYIAAGPLLSDFVKYRNLKMDYLVRYTRDAAQESYLTWAVNFFSGAPTSEQKAEEKATQSFVPTNR